MKRRCYLATASGAIAATLAGCEDVLGEDDDGPEAVVVEWYEAWREEDIDSMAQLIHGESAFDVDDRGATVDEPPADVDPRSFSDPNGDEFRERAAGWLDEDAIDRILDDEETAILIVEEADITHVLATEDGEWKLVR